MRGKPDVNTLILLDYYIRYTIWAMFICSHLGVLKNEFCEFQYCVKYFLWSNFVQVSR